MTEEAINGKIHALKDEKMEALAPIKQRIADKGNEIKGIDRQLKELFDKRKPINRAIQELQCVRAGIVKERKKITTELSNTATAFEDERRKLVEQLLKIQGEKNE